MANAPAFLNVADYGAVGDYDVAPQAPTDNLPKFEAALLALPDRGGILLVPPGNFYFSGTLNLNKQVTVTGAGVGAVSANYTATMLTFKAGQTGITVRSTADYALVENLGVCSLSNGDGGVGNGVEVFGHAVTLSRLLVCRFGNHGVSLDTTTAHNINNCIIQGVSSRSNGRNGFHTDGRDSNAITFFGCDATGNKGYGFVDGSANNLYLNPHADHNNLGGYFADANSGTAISVYSEGGQVFRFSKKAANWLVRTGAYAPPSFEFEANDGTFDDPTKPSIARENNFVWQNGTLLSGNLYLGNRIFLRYFWDGPLPSAGNDMNGAIVFKRTGDHDGLWYYMQGKRFKVQAVEA